MGLGWRESDLQGLMGFFMLVVEYTVDLETVHAMLNTYAHGIQQLSSDTQRVQNMLRYITAQMSAFIQM